jgi:hypothetical protein
MNDYQVENLLKKYNKIDTSMLTNLTSLLYNQNVKITLEEIRDCFSKGQLASKLWLIDELNKLNIGQDLKIMILGGWIGSLANLLFQFSNSYVRKIVSIDIDPRCEMIADYLNVEDLIEGWRFKAFTRDMYALDYSNLILYDEHYEMHFNPNVFVNTSCEHIPHLPTWLGLIPHGKLVILQSNNYFDHEQHVNCVSSADEFEEQCAMLNSVLFKGTMETELYDRYMIIGTR